MTKLTFTRLLFLILTTISSFGQNITNDHITTGSDDIDSTKSQITSKNSNSQSIRLGVLSYNIHHCEGVDGKLDVSRIARVILSVKPDLVALQEVDQNTKRTGKVNQTAELSRLTKMTSIFGSNIDFQGGQYGNVILSSFPIIKKNNLYLPNVNSGEQRGVLKALVAVSKQKSVVLLSTHLDHRRSDEERLASAKFINQMISITDSSPAILAGDFNDVPDSPTLKEFGRLWIRSNTNVMPTVPVAKPTRQIDYILVRPKEGWRVIESKVLDEDIASDHRAIFTIIELMN